MEVDGSGGRVGVGSVMKKAFGRREPRWAVVGVDKGLRATGVCHKVG